MKCLNGNSYVLHIIKKNHLCKVIPHLKKNCQHTFILLLMDDILELMQWYQPYGLNEKKIVHQRWLHMVKVDRSTNGMVGKPCIKKL